MVYIPKKGLSGGTKKSKYRNKKVRFQGKLFDSIGERDRYIFLQEQERLGIIFDLRRQVEFSIDFNGVHICKYIADFTYSITRRTKQDETAIVQVGDYTVEDFKGVQTAEFKLKRKMMLACHGIDIRIVKNPTLEI